MNDGMLVVNFSALEQASDNIQNAINRLTGDLEELAKQGSTLAQSWDGKAKEVYFDRQQAWEAASTELKETLRQIQRALDCSKDDYLNTENRAASLFQ